MKLPEGGVDALLASADSPLAAPGHGYVPPQITVAPATTAGTDPAATGTWAMPTAPVDGTQWQVPDAGQEPAAHQGYAEYPQQDPYGGSAPYDTNAPYDVHAGQGDRFTYRPGATGQWDFSEAAASDGTAPEPDAASGQDVTGQWSIPVADGDLPDESGEFTQSSLAEQWGGTAPATLPGGAPAPWATQPAGQPWGDRAAEAAPGGPERPSEAATSAPGAPEPAAGPYVEAPGTRRGDRALGIGGRRDADRRAGDRRAPEGRGDLRGARRAIRGHRRGRGGGIRPGGRRGARDGPGADRRAGREPEPGQEREPGREHESAQEHESGREHAPGQERERGPEAEPRTAPRTETTRPPPGPTRPSAPPRPTRPPLRSGPPPDGTRNTPSPPTCCASTAPTRPVTDAWIGESLLYVLRERLGLAGAKDGCSQGECGACNVQVDGRLVASCLVPAVTSAGSEVRTVEGLAADGRPSDVQRALARRGAVQCGFCVPGMAMTLHNLLEGNPAPTELEARQALCGNLCRCSGYRGVLEAVKEVVAEREAHATADAAGTDADEPRIPHQAGPGAGGVNPSAFEPQGPPGTPDAPGPHDQPYGENGQDGGHA